MTRRSKTHKIETHDVIISVKDPRFTEEIRGSAVPFLTRLVC